MAETYPNRFYQHAAQTDRIHNSTAMSSLPTIWERLQGAGLTGKYYFNDVPFLALWGSTYAGISRPFSEFLVDCAAGALPQVSYIDPAFWMKPAAPRTTIILMPTFGTARLS